ncbi:MAG: hypothetical protein OXH52_12275 [Gammaproteobacteria bacterium]|nr:hypothetical protein [Gammaproteobacteria bacterium]
MTGGDEMRRVGVYVHVEDKNFAVFDQALDDGEFPGSRQEYERLGSLPLVVERSEVGGTEYLIVERGDTWISSPADPVLHAGHAAAELRARDNALQPAANTETVN